MSGVILPQIRQISLRSFQPLFNVPNLQMELPTGPFLLLGGNALGKTTTLQAVVFALAGDADPPIEEKTDFQWGTAYFKSRVNEPSQAEIQVEFRLKDTIIAVRRRMNSKSVRAVKIQDRTWIEDSNEATHNYEQAVCEAGEYQKFEDFRYLVHRLCYLAENRRSLVWDQGAQLRVVMMICGDIVMEREFRTLRATLKELDSEARHAHVDIGHLENRLQRISGRSGNRAGARDGSDGSRRAIELSAKLEAELQPLAKQRLRLREQLKVFRKRLLILNSELDELQQKLSRMEDTLVLDALRGIENSSAALALHKLLVHERCPFCTQRTEQLATKAREAIDQGKCPICGQSHALNVSAEEIAALRSEITDRTARQEDLQRSVELLEDEDSQLMTREIGIRDRLDILVAKLPRVQFAEVSAVVGDSPGELRKRLRTTRAHHARLEARKRNVEPAGSRGQVSKFKRSASRRVARVPRA